MYRIASSLLLAVLVPWASSGAAQSLDIPCSTCPAMRRPPLPESGFWHNPLQPGSGFSLEVQNRTLAGAYFGYTTSGAPVWYVFSGLLARADATSPAAWSVDAQAFELSGGACWGCTYTPPSSERAVARLRFEFLQRGLARYRLDDGPWAVIQAFTFGVATAPVAPMVAYPFVDLNGTWVLVFQGEEPSQRAYTAFAATGTMPVAYPGNGATFFSNGGASPISIGALQCPLADDGTPYCVYNADAGYSRFSNASAKEFILSLGNLTDSRFKGVAADGETVEGFRLDYD